MSPQRRVYTYQNKEVASGGGMGGGGGGASPKHKKHSLKHLNSFYQIEQLKVQVVQPSQQNLKGAIR